jgi:hypothetical protein
MAATRGWLWHVVSLSAQIMHSNSNREQAVEESSRTQQEGSNGGRKTAQTEAKCKNHEHENYKCVRFVYENMFATTKLWVKRCS